VQQRRERFLKLSKQQEELLNNKLQQQNKQAEVLLI
jgi:hypothetical protein